MAEKPLKLVEDQQLCWVVSQVYFAGSMVSTLVASLMVWQSPSEKWVEE